MNDTKPFRCGHTRTPENSVRHGLLNKYMRCRMCSNESHRLRQVRRRKDARLPPRAKPYMENDPAVQLYRAERAKREGQVLLAINSVRPAYARAIEKPKGGRPVSVGRGRRSA